MRLLYHRLLIIVQTRSTFPEVEDDEHSLTGNYLSSSVRMILNEEMLRYYLVVEAKRKRRNFPIAGIYPL